MIVTRRVPALICDKERAGRACCGSGDRGGGGVGRCQNGSRRLLLRRCLSVVRDAIVHVSGGRALKLRMAKNSLFAVLLRSPWWISALIAVVLAMLGLVALPERFRVIGVLSGAPFLVIAAISARRRWHLPSSARVAETHTALGRMAWPAFAELLQHSFRRDGYTVSPGKSTAVDFELTRDGRRMFVCARRWKSARTGLEALRALQAARDADDPPHALYIGLGPLTDTALPFAAQHGITIWGAAELAQALRGLPLAAQR